MQQQRRLLHLPALDRCCTKFQQDSAAARKPQVVVVAVRSAVISRDPCIGGTLQDSFFGAGGAAQGENRQYNTVSSVHFGGKQGRRQAAGSFPAGASTPV